MPRPLDSVKHNPNPYDIAVFEENTKGHDIIAGDIHGSLTILANLVQKLRSGDRLFIVGDLADRGKDSLAVFEFIKKHNAKNPIPQIFSIKGNHEDLLLDYIDTRLNSEKYTTKEEATIVNTYKNNGGKWAFNLTDAQLKDLKMQIDQMPYIMHVRGKDPFNIVHADMPFDDQELFRRIGAREFSLSEAEKNYATWARRKGEVMLIPTGRDQHSLPTYCGHTIMGGMRRNTNHINLDLGSFETNHIGVVNHSTRKCAIYTTEPTLDDAAVKIQANINKQLAKQGKIVNSKVKDRIVNETALTKETILPMLTSPSYHANNGKSKFQFFQTAKKIPESALSNPQVNMDEISKINESLIHRIKEIALVRATEYKYCAVNKTQIANFIEKADDIISAKLTPLELFKNLVAHFERTYSLASNAWEGDGTFDKKNKVMGYTSHLNSYSTYDPMLVIAISLNDIYSTYNDKLLEPDQHKFRQQCSKAVGMLDNDDYQFHPLRNTTAALLTLSSKKNGAEIDKLPHIVAAKRRV